jgi:hypothetical protein
MAYSCSDDLEEDLEVELMLEVERFCRGAKASNVESAALRKDARVVRRGDKHTPVDWASPDKPSSTCYAASRGAKRNG